jgi:hypothetical protein
MWTDVDKCHHLSKQNVKLILKILSNLELLRGSSNKKHCIQLVRVSIGLFWHSWAFKLDHSCQKNPIYTRILILFCVTTYYIFYYFNYFLINMDIFAGTWIYHAEGCKVSFYVFV